MEGYRVQNFVNPSMQVKCIVLIKLHYPQWGYIEGAFSISCPCGEIVTYNKTSNCCIEFVVVDIGIYMFM